MINTQKKFRLYSDKYKVVNHISECSKFAQKKHNSRYDWWDEWLTGNYARDKNLTPLKNSTCTKQNLSMKMRPIKNLGDLEIQIDHPISARRRDLVLIDKKKRTHNLVDCAIQGDNMKMKESEKTNKYLNLAWELKRIWNMEVIVIPGVIGNLGIVTYDLEKKLRDLEIRGRIMKI